MSTLLVACSFTILAAVASYEKNPPNAALEWRPVTWFVLHLSVALLVVTVVVTCATRRERVDSKAPLGMDLVERGVLRGEQPAGFCEWLSHRWPWSPVPLRSPQLSRLRVGLARSTQSLLHYQLIEKRHVHFTRGALCVLRTDLQELQELAEKENTTRRSRESRHIGDVARKSNGSWRGSANGSPIERFVSVSGNPVVQLGTVQPVESSGQPLFRTVESIESSNHHVSWSESTGDVTSGAEGGEGEPHYKDSVVIRDDSLRSHNQINNSNSALDVKNMVKGSTVDETISPNETADTGGKDDSQLPIIATEEVSQGNHFTPFKNVVKARSYIDIHREEGKKSEPTTFLEGAQANRELLTLHKAHSATDLGQTSDSDVLLEISGSSEDFHSDPSLHEQSQEHGSLLVDNTVLGNEYKTSRYISTPTGDPEFSPSQKDIPSAIVNATTQSPSAYISILDKGTPKLPRHTLAKKETEDVDNIRASVSSCFLHSVAPLSQQEYLQFKKHNSSKSEKEKSVHHLQYPKQTEYQVAPASVVNTNNTFFISNNTITKEQNAKSSGMNAAAEEGPGLQTMWDLLHSFPCDTDTVQMARMGTRSKLNTVSESHSGIKQHDEHSIYLSCKGDDVLPTKHQQSDNRHKWLAPDRHTSRVVQKPSSSRPDCSSVSDSANIAIQQHSPLATTVNAGERHTVLQWRITVSPHLVGSSKSHTKLPDQGQNQH